MISGRDWTRKSLRRKKVRKRYLQYTGIMLILLVIMVLFVCPYSSGNVLFYCDDVKFF
jgi:hypothetical protein